MSALETSPVRRHDTTRCCRERPGTVVRRTGSRRTLLAAAVVLLLVSTGVVAATPAHAAGGDHVGVIGFGGGGTDVGRAIAVDAAGNVTTAGYFSGTVDFDPGTGTAPLTANGDFDAFVARFDADGRYVWARNLGGTGGDYGQAIAVDAGGNVYTTGSFAGTADFDPGPGTAPLAAHGAADVFVVRLDADGRYVWARNLGGTGNDFGQAIAVDAGGNVYTTGSFAGTADFDPGTASAPLIAHGELDVFVAKLDPAGNHEWAGNVGGVDFDLGQGLALGPTGHVYITGFFAGTVDVDPGPGVTDLTSNGGRDAFVIGFGAEGDQTWAVNLGGATDDFGQAVTVDATGNVFATGSFSGTADFDPGPASAALTADAQFDAFISKLDADGAHQWAARLGGSGFDAGAALATDAVGSVYATGFFTGTADFDPGPRVSSRTSRGDRDVFVAKLGPSGRFEWSAAMGGTNTDEGAGVAVDAAGNVATTGFFTGAADFDPGPGTAQLTAVSGGDVFVSRLTASGRCGGRIVTVDIANGDMPTTASDVILGTPGADLIDALGGDDVICGGAGVDVITGGDGDDVIYGGAGSDEVDAGAGADTVFGGVGDDEIHGADDADLISGNAGNDTISGGGGADTIYGVDGDDRIAGQGGDDIVLGGGDRDTIEGGDGADLMSGNTGDDTVSGEGGADEVYGADGNDSLTGGVGRDVILGGNDDDTIDVVDGERDQVSGGAGADTCRRDVGLDIAFACETLLS